MISGYDYVINIAPKEQDCLLILNMFAKYWPHAIFEDADAESAFSLSAVISQGCRSSEFFIYRDRIVFKRWDSGEFGYEDDSNMVHVILGKTITLVLDSQESPQLALARDIAQALMASRTTQNCLTTAESRLCYSLPKHLPEELKKTMDDAGLDRYEFAARAGVSAETIRRVLHGKIALKNDYVRKYILRAISLTKANDAVVIDQQRRFLEAGKIAAEGIAVPHLWIYGSPISQSVIGQLKRGSPITPYVLYRINQDFPDVSTKIQEALGFDDPKYTPTPAIERLRKSYLRYIRANGDLTDPEEEDNEDDGATMCGVETVCGDEFDELVDAFSDTIKKCYGNLSNKLQKVVFAAEEALRKQGFNAKVSVESNKEFRLMVDQKDLGALVISTGSGIKPTFDGNSVVSVDDFVSCLSKKIEAFLLG